jgi:hypothetical protein
VRAKLKRLVPVKDTWTLDCFFTDNIEGDWAFHLPQFLTFNELLCNGTQEVISYYYEKLSGRKPDKSSRIKLTVSTKDSPDCTTRNLWLYEDPLWTGANYYIDQETKKDVWLCPYLPFLFGGAPQFLFITIKVVS